MGGGKGAATQGGGGRGGEAPGVGGGWGGSRLEVDRRGGGCLGSFRWGGCVTGVGLVFFFFYPLCFFIHIFLCLGKVATGWPETWQLCPRGSWAPETG